MTFYLNSTVVIKYCLYLTQLKLLLKDYFRFLQWFTEDVMHCGLISCKKITWDILNNWFQNCICILETYCNERKPRADGWSKIFMSCSEKGTLSLSIQSQVEMYTMLTISITGKRWCCYWSLTISHSLFPFLGSPLPPSTPEKWLSLKSSARVDASGCYTYLCCSTAVKVLSEIDVSGSSFLLSLI